MTPVVAISKPPSWVSGSVIISGLVPGISIVDLLVCVGGGCVVNFVSEKVVDFVSSEVVGCTSIDSEI